MIGIVTWFNSEKGYGEIKDGVGNRYYFTKNLATAKIKKGSLVTFETQNDKLLFGSPRVKSLEITSKRLTKDPSSKAIIHDLLGEKL